MTVSALRLALGTHLGQVLTPELAAQIEQSVADKCLHEKPQWEALSTETLSELLCGDSDAIEFYLHVARWTHTYDDLVDADKPITEEQLHVFVWRMLFDIPLNPFFDKYQGIFRPLLMNGILNWIAANDMEASKDKEQLRVAHVIRYSVGDILLAAMAITGGMEHARKNARRARLMIQDETWIHYLTEKQGVA